MLNNQAIPTQAQIRITRLDLLETGTYNPMYARPYEMSVSGDLLNDIRNRVENVDGGKISPVLFGGIASSVMRPSVNRENEIPIYMGWNERRLRFIMYVDVYSTQGGVSSYIFQGFTNTLGVSHNGSYDPKMLFIINSFVRMNTRAVQTEYGMKNESVMTESCQIINGQIVRDPTIGNDVYGMRPSDVFTGIQSQYLAGAYEGYGQGQLLDTRIGLGGESISSKRANCLPSNYLTTIVNSYQTSKDLLAYGQGSDDLYARSRELAYEVSPNENKFIRQLSHVRGVQNQTTFTLGDLKSIDPGVESVTAYRTLGQVAKSTLHNAGSTAYWHGSDNETLWATLLSNAIPAIMMELMIGQVSFFSTNDTIGGVFQTSIGNMMGLSNTDMSRYMALFIARLEREIMTDLTYNGHIYHLNMTVSVYGESTIDIKIDHGEMIRFTTPSYCDGLFAPIYTSNKSAYNQMVGDFETFMNELPNGIASGGTQGFASGSLAVNNSI